jgi:hypothetical protein
MGNPFRDLGLQFLGSQNYSPVLPVAWAQMARNFAKMLNKGRYERGMAKYIKNGGSTSFLSTMNLLSDMHSESAVTPGKKLGNKILETMGWLGQTSEQVVRLMLVEQALRKAGTTMDKATDAQWAKAVHEASTFQDFRQHGQYAKMVDLVVPFFNPAVQSIRPVMREFKNNPAISTFKAAQIVAVGAALAAFNRENDEEGWESATDSEKDTKALFFFGLKAKDKNGDNRSGYGAIPIDQAWRPFFILGEMISEKMAGKPVNPARLSGIISANYVPGDINSLPPVMAAMLTYTQNKDFWTKQDVWRGAKVEPYMERRASTPEIANLAGDITGMSPERLTAAKRKLIPDNPWSFGAEKLVELMSGKTADQDTFSALSSMPMLRRVMRMTPNRELRRDDLLSAARLGVKVNGRTPAVVLNEIDEKQTERNTVRQQHKLAIDTMIQEIKKGKATQADLIRSLISMRDEKGRRIGPEEIRELRKRYTDRYPHGIPTP